MMKNNENLTEFIDAIKNGRLDSVESYYNDEYLNESDGMMRPIEYACENNYVDIAKYLLVKGCDVEFKNKKGESLVHIVASKGHVDMMQVLMDHNCNIEAVDKVESRAVHYAAWFGHVNILQWLWDHNFEMEAVNVHKSKAIHCGARNGHVNVLQWLMDHKYDMEAMNKNGNKAAHCAAAYGHENVLQWLMDHNYSIEETNKQGSRAVVYAAHNVHVKTLRWLMDHNCDMSRRLNGVKSPLDIVTRRQNESCIELLKIDKGIRHAYKRMHSTGSSIGRGGFGEVFRHTDIKVDFAIKRVTQTYDSSSHNCTNSAENEILIFKKLPSHPRIVQYFGTKREECVMYIFMEPVTGGSLQDYLNEQGPLGSTMIAHFTKQILEGLDLLHSNNIIHRDIKCANILRDSENNVKLCDFGISRYLGTTDLVNENQSMLTSVCNDECRDMADTSCGTSYWMAPEVVRGDPYSTSADVWSLGATVVEMLTGTHPYPDLGPTKAKYNIGHRERIEYTTPREISIEFQSFIDQMLVPDPCERATTKELLESDFILGDSDKL